MKRIAFVLTFCLALCFVARAQSDTIDKEKVFKPVEVVPSFPGGMEALYKFLGRTVRYPATARENNTQGSVRVSFVVEKDGALTDIKVTRGIGDGCDEEAVRVMKLSPKWIPGSQGGKAVRVVYSIPISFALSN